MSAAVAPLAVGADLADDRPRHAYTPEQLRSFLKQESWCIGVTMLTLGNYLDLRDDAGAAYAIKTLVARTRAAADAMTILRSLMGGRDAGR
jgi:hypothetical protein